MIYTNNIAKYESDFKKIKDKSRKTAYLRVLVFIIILSEMYFYESIGLNLFFPLLILSIGAFLWLLQKAYGLKLKAEYVESLIKINKTEAQLTSSNFSDIYSGKDYMNPNHKFTYDLDIFGESSVFMLLNRSATVIGQNYLAEKLSNLSTDKEDILRKQKAINELKPLVKWRQNYQAAGLQYLITHNEAKDKDKNLVKEQNKKVLLNWITNEAVFLNNKIVKTTSIIFPVITISLLFLGIFKFVPINLFFLSGIFQLMFLGIFLKKINKLHSKTGKTSKILNNYAKLLKLIEQQKFKSEKLISLQKELIKYNNTSASKSTEKLKSILAMLDNRMNLLFAFLFNFLFLWDLHTVLSLERWQKQHKNIVKKWLNVIKEFDVLNSFAGFAYNNPTFCIPKISAEEFEYTIQNGGHPIIPEKERVCNNFTLSEKGSFAIITGANMAGKSTFLRTTAVNLILACNGSNVCAQSFTFTPVEIFTSIRTNDSLSKNESYFYAELKRLQTIIGEIKSGKKLFVIVDEMLRGTNSKDKHYGSKAFIEQVVKYNASGLIATHDVMLGELEKELKKVKNLRFEVNINQDKLTFDYKLRKGVSQNLNATFLMKKMGIIEK